MCSTELSWPTLWVSAIVQATGRRAATLISYFVLQAWDGSNELSAKGKIGNNEPEAIDVLMRETRKSHLVLAKIL